MSRLERLKRRPEFLRVASRGRKAATPGLVLQALERQESPPTSQPRPPQKTADSAPVPQACVSRVRVGFTASRKVGKAVERNRARRRLRAAAELVLPTAARPGWDYVLVARRGTLTRSWPDLLEDLRSALLRVEKQEQKRSSARRRSGTGHRLTQPPKVRNGSMEAE